MRHAEKDFATPHSDNSLLPATASFADIAAAANGLAAQTVGESLDAPMKAGLAEKRDVAGAYGDEEAEYEPVVPPSMTAIMAKFPTFADSACKYLRLNSENPHEKAAKIGAIWSGQVLAEISRENGMPILDAEFFRIPARRAASASLVPDTFDTRGVAPAQTCVPRLLGVVLDVSKLGRTPDTSRNNGSRPC